MENLKQNLVLQGFDNLDDDMMMNSYSMSCEISQGEFRIVNQDVKIDRNGLQNTRTGERSSMILPSEIEVKYTSNFKLILPQYQEILGKGNGGMVYKALLKPSGLPLAIKSINILDKEKRHQLYNDLRSLVQEECPFLIRFYGAYYDEGSVYLALEYMDCGSVNTIMKIMKQAFPTQIPLIPELVISSITCQVLKGIQYLHEVRKQLHRDVKPDNILVSSQFGEAKITDFGISKDIEATLNMCSTFVGTLSYMSPERIEGENYTFPSDIWSIGVAVYEMAIGRHPYPEATNPYALHEMMRTQPPPSLAGIHGISLELADFVSRCLQIEPQKRARASELLRHPFIQRYIQADADLIFWLKDYLDVYENVRKQNLDKQREFEMSLSDLVGLK
eukprot:403361988